MSELHESFTDGLFEARWRPGVQLEFHREENKQSHRTEGHKSEANKINQIKIELLNMPVIALVMPDSKVAEKPNPINSDTTVSFLDIIAIILEMIVDGAKAMFQKRKAMLL